MLNQWKVQLRLRAEARKLLGVRAGDRSPVRPSRPAILVLCHPSPSSSSSSSSSCDPRPRPCRRPPRPPLLLVLVLVLVLVPYATRTCVNQGGRAFRSDVRLARYAHSIVRSDRPSHTISYLLGSTRKCTLDDSTRTSIADLELAGRTDHGHVVRLGCALSVLERKSISDALSIHQGGKPDERRSTPQLCSSTFQPLVSGLSQVLHVHQ